MNTEDTIIPLKGPDRVRRRPAVIFGNHEEEWAINAIKMLLDLFFTEAALGYCKKIAVMLEEDHSVTVESFDRGLFLDETEQDGKPAWFNVFCDFACGPREANAEYLHYCRMKHNVLFGDKTEPSLKFMSETDSAFDLCVFQYVCEWMKVESVHGSVLGRLCFEKGYAVSELEKEPASKTSYTKISFKLDREILDDGAVTFEALSAILRGGAICNPGLNCTVYHREEKATFFYPKGCADYLKERCDSAESTPVFFSEILANGKDRYNRENYDASVRAAVVFVAGGGGAECFHNFRSLPDGGKHLNAAKKKIVRALQRRFDEFEFLNEKFIFDRMLLVLVTNCSERMTRWSNREGTALGNRMIAEMSSDVFGGDFDHYLKMNAEKLLSLLSEKQI